MINLILNNTNEVAKHELRYKNLVAAVSIIFSISIVHIKSKLFKESERADNFQIHGWLPKTAKCTVLQFGHTIMRIWALSEYKKNASLHFTFKHVSKGYKIKLYFRKIIN